MKGAEKTSMGTLATAATHQLGQDHPDLEGLAEADGIRDEDARPNGWL